MSRVTSVLLACLIAAGSGGLSAALAHTAARGEASGDFSSADSDRTARGQIEIVVSLSEQRAYVYRNGRQIAESEASTGKDGYETPTGVFPILEKQRYHRSSKYNDAPMPYMQRLTWYGVALHGGEPLPGYAASHGCIRLPLAFARKLFGLTSVGTTVVVTDGPPDAEALSAHPSEAAPDEGPPDEGPPDRGPAEEPIPDDAPPDAP
ncbi:MAG TPA: L,D-transpeptidase family protein [Caulobacteraceae bacterium]|nr:L,D-transpeptidase family protein [Caulobacteraceae bacterium]